MIDFTVSEIPLTTKDGTFKGLEKYKALVRDDNDECLSIVGADYRVFQNDEVFGAIEDKIAQAVGRKGMRHMTTDESAVKGGQTCLKSYTFPDITVPSTKGSRADIRFRAIGVNGFGGRSVKVLYGGIDYFCSNGLLIGEQVNEIMFRHTKNNVVSTNVNPVKDALETFHRYGDKWKQWQTQPCSHADAEEVLNASFTETLAKALVARFTTEAVDLARGMTVWSLYSAMTYYASHDSAQFPISIFAVRNRNQLGVLLDRSQHVVRVVNSPVWQNQFGD